MTPTTSPKPSAGVYAALPWGRTWYQAAGPESGLPVVLIHGFSVPSCVWDGTFEHLAQVGFRVLRYDLYGRGRSARPADCLYDLPCYLAQLTGLLEEVGWADRPLSVVGLSMGGPIAAAFAADNPDRLRALALIDPVVAGVPLNWKQRLLAVPLLGEILLRWLGPRVLVQGIRADFHRQEHLPSRLLRGYRSFMDSGFFRALHRTMRHGMLGDQRPVFAALGRTAVPVLAVWGKEDATVPVAQAEILRQLVPQARVEIIPEAGHVPHWEQPEQVHTLLSRFLAP